jgi:hypothetical protein
MVIALLLEYSTTFDVGLSVVWEKIEDELIVTIASADLVKSTG